MRSRADRFARGSAQCLKRSATDRIGLLVLTSIDCLHLGWRQRGRREVVRFLALHSADRLANRLTLVIKSACLHQAADERLLLFCQCVTHDRKKIRQLMENVEFGGAAWQSTSQ